MTDSYDRKGVTITPKGGGHYDISHPSLAEPEQVRGKEAAEARADEIAVAATAGDPTAKMDPNPDLDAALQQQPEAPPTAPPHPPAAPPPTPAPTPAPTATVNIEEAPAETPIHRIPVIPSKFEGLVEPKVKKASGIEWKRIVLEEQDDIPPTGLFVAHNGKSYMIATGVEVDVPVVILGVLDDAVMSSPVKDGKTQKIKGYRNRSKYPYRVIH